MASEQKDVDDSQHAEDRNDNDHDSQLAEDDMKRLVTHELTVMTRTFNTLKFNQQMVEIKKQLDYVAVTIAQFARRISMYSGSSSIITYLIQSTI